MELVDRRRLLAEAQKLNSVITGRDKPIPVAEAFMSVIEKQPTVEPRAKGHWIHHKNADIVDGFYVPKYECSECHAWKEDDSDYCPSCGTDMRGEKDG